MQHRPKIENDLCNNGIEKYTLASFTAPQNIRIQKLNMHPEEQRGREVDTSNSCEDSMNLVNPSIPKMEVLDACFLNCIKENASQQYIFKTF